MTWEHKLASCFAGAALGVALSMCEAHSAEAKPPQSARPWTIAQCDRLGLGRAKAVFNQSIWSHSGWPLWRVVCWY